MRNTLPQVPLHANSRDLSVERHTFIHCQEKEEGCKTDAGRGAQLASGIAERESCPDKG